MPYIVVFVFGGFRLRREMIVCFVDIGGSLKKHFFVRERHEDIIYCQKNSTLTKITHFFRHLWQPVIDIKTVKSN
jgi:hypothetical protein